MLFWIIAALLTLGACLAVLLPLARGGGAQASAREHDLEVYRDQLAELDRDAARGLIGEAEAEQARAEIGRRILRASEAAAPKGGGQSGALRWAALAAVLAIPLVSWSVYGGVGSPGMAGQPLRERLARDPAQASLEELVARAERHLAANPSDGQGWEVVAPIYLRMGRPEDAAEAYANAIRLLGASAAREAALGEALAAAAGGKIGADAQAAFSRAVELEPENAKARYYLAAADAQGGRAAEAVEQWRALVAAEPEDSPWRQAAQQALQATAADQPGPTRQEAEAAAAMGPEERGAMIEGMVASLDQRLRQNPHDKEGWKRLVRSYMVLGREDDARDALERGIDALGAGTDEAVELEMSAASLRLREQGRE